MRSSKSRSRSKSNRNNNRSVGNITNRVFDSSGPEGKVRGTPQQIIDKYNQLTRDAQLSNDRVAAENFAQHAEHYTRMLGEAQREQEARREQQERENQQRQRERDAERAARQEQESNAPAKSREPQQQQDPAKPADPGEGAQPDVVMESGDSGLVETPESAPRPKPRRRTRKPQPDAASAETPDQPSETPDAAE